MLKVHPVDATDEALLVGTAKNFYLNLKVVREVP